MIAVREEPNLHIVFYLRDVMQRNAWKANANWRINRPNNNTKSRRHARMTTKLKEKKLDQLENCPQCLLTNGSKMSIFGSY